MDEEIENKTALLNEPSDSLTSNFGENTPDGVLEKIGYRNGFILYIFISSSLVWLLAAMPMLSSAFLTDTVGYSNTNLTGSLSIVDEFHLFDNRAYLLQWTAGSFLLGNMVGGSVISRFSDKYGRRIMMVFSLFGLGLSGCISAMATNIYFFIFMRLCQGACFTGSSLTNWVLAYESIPKNLRSYTTLVFGIQWVIGYCLVAPLAYFFPYWRHFLVALSLPSCFFGVLFFVTIPESFHFLVGKKNFKKTSEWIESAEKSTGKKLDVDMAKLLENIDEDSNTNSKNGCISEFLSNKTLIVDTLIMAYLWTCDTLVYYGLSLFSTQLAGNNYVNYLLSGLVELPSYIIAPFILDWWGRKGAVSSMHFLAGAMLILASFISSASTFRLILWMIAKFAIACVFTSIFAYGSEVFPTTVRNFSMGMCAVTARFMGTFAPFTQSLEIIWASLPLFSFGVLAMLASCLTLILPETKNRNLPATASSV
uniref:Major facilitator superfamily (MFS) profile domain-containing protein n=1 Tax=Acrobeloides nanus TaxID=290746 RepID=A0A914C430_9BILA